MKKSLIRRLNDVRDDLEAALSTLDGLIEEYEGISGPENSREEVSPTDRSPQRDCPTRPVAAAAGCSEERRDPVSATPIAPETTYGRPWRSPGDDEGSGEARDDRSPGASLIRAV